MDVWGIDGQSALVTGASSGIGRTTVQRLAAAGCRVAALGRDAGALATVVAEVGIESLPCLHR